MNVDWFLAAENGDTHAVLEMLDRGAKVDAPGKYGETALKLAVRGRHMEIIKALLQRGANPNAGVYPGSKTAMTEAVLQARGWQIALGRCWRTLEPDDRYLQTLLEAGGRLGLREAILLGDVELARSICDGDNSLDLNDEANFGMHETYLMLASQVGPPAMVEFLLDRGADIEGKDDIGHNALLRAAESGQAGVVELLIDRGARINYGWPCDTALTKAMEHNHLDVVTLLVSRGGVSGHTFSAFGF